MISAAHRKHAVAAFVVVGLLLFAFTLATGVAVDHAEEGFARCAAAFPRDNTESAPQRIKPSAATQADSVPLCYRLGDDVFFVVEYSSRRRMANWVAHKLEDRFGADGCGSIPRDDLKCYFGEENVTACLKKKPKDKPGDPFHVDGTLTKLEKPRLGIGAFGGTGHDRGHLAPNQSFSWHICGAYKTFTMANMAPQLAALNRGLWAHLEEQVLFWAVTEGPIYVVTGTMFTTFPADKFKIIKTGGVEREAIVRPGEKLKPDASGPPSQVVKPTGFYKVIFRPGRGGDSDQAVAFLVPHTRDEMDLHYKNSLLGSTWWNVRADSPSQCPKP